MDRNSVLPGLPALAAGILAGVCMGVAVACAALFAAWRASPAATPTRPAVPTSFYPARTSQPRIATASPTVDPATALFAAQARLDRGDSQGAIDLLTPFVGQWTQSVDLAQGFDLLGQAELQLSHSRLAGAYFERAYGLVPNPDRLYWMALAYDLGGDLERALSRYVELVAWPGEKADGYREFATARIEHIAEILGTPAPGQ